MTVARVGMRLVSAGVRAGSGALFDRFFQGIGHVHAVLEVAFVVIVGYLALMAGQAMAGPSPLRQAMRPTGPVRLCPRHRRFGDALVRWGRFRVAVVVGVLLSPLVVVGARLTGFGLPGPEYCPRCAVSVPAGPAGDQREVG